jgi:hypothetical protein
VWVKGYYWSFNFCTIKLILICKSFWSTLQNVILKNMTIFHFQKSLTKTKTYNWVKWIFSLNSLAFMGVKKITCCGYHDLKLHNTNRPLTLNVGFSHLPFWLLWVCCDPIVHLMKFNEIVLVLLDLNLNLSIEILNHGTKLKFIETILCLMKLSSTKLEMLEI